VGVATLGVAYALIITIHNRYETLNEEELLDKIQ
jgi:multicomponent Na+:H+ antiporter subunit C